MVSRHSRWGDTGEIIGSGHRMCSEPNEMRHITFYSMDLHIISFTVQLGRGASIQLGDIVINTSNIGATIQFGGLQFHGSIEMTTVALVYDMESEGPIRRPHFGPRDRMQLKPAQDWVNLGLVKGSRKVSFSNWSRFSACFRTKQKELGSFLASGGSKRSWVLCLVGVDGKEFLRGLLRLAVGAKGESLL
ncbi:hypothetical protein MA16_Dca021652 [Dendrobium catenatum]|uniref:Uncharacterized protein n=1 Tax=Dendrobium catenatum TaxID=906689 RepID=A0A2I0W1H9_9ASPA|nr:hypothetical protein MA16_Dca021652 [Dendrobium catenatum]